jgi:hypothetical protein
MQFKAALQVLSDAFVDFVVIGGMAATFHGSARVTYDLDICYARTPENLRRLAKALSPFHPRPRDFPSGLPFQQGDRKTSSRGASNSNGSNNPQDFA